MPNELKIQVNELAEKFAIHMVTEIFRHMEVQRRLRGDDFSNLLPGAFLARFVGALLFRSLKIPLTATTEDGAVHQSLHNFATVKLDIQESIANGFQTAMLLHSGVPNEYYCQIKLIPPPPKGEHQTN